MTKPEFEIWFKFHCGCFPAVSSWFQDKSKVPDPASTLSAWLGTLSKVSLEAAKKATALMHSGDEDLPRGYSHHPAAIRRVAQQFDRSEAQATGADSPTQYIDGQIVYGCQHCQDTGVRFIVSPATIERIRNAYGERDQMHGFGGVTQVAACRCPSGDRHTQTRHTAGKQLQPLPVFYESSMLEHDPAWSPDDLIQAVMAWGSKSFTADDWAG